MRTYGWGKIAIGAVLALSIVFVGPVAAQTISGQLAVEWGDGPDAAHRVVLVDAEGNRIPVQLPDSVLAMGLGSLERKFVSVDGQLLSSTFDGSQALVASAVEFQDVPKLADGVMARAQSDGTVRVIVWLNTGFQPEGTLAGAAAVDAQRSTIASATDSVAGALAGTQFEVVNTFETVPLMAVVAGADALNVLASSPLVERVEIDGLSAPQLPQSIPLIGATGAHSAGWTGAYITTAILDTGVMKTHTAFSGRVISEACYSSTGSTSNGTYQSLCPGGVTASTAVGSGVNCTGIGGCDHGTHVAGIAAGSPFSGFTSPGVGRSAWIIAIQVFTRFNSSIDCQGTAPCVLAFTSDQIKGLERVYALRTSRKIASANMSLGGGLTSVNCDSDSRKPIIDNLRAAGIVTAIAAGNNGNRSNISFPACISSAVSVGSTTDGGTGATPVDTVSSFSNAANIMSMWAPGQVTTAPVITSTTATGDKNGTSMATPHVAGALALLREKRPYGTAAELISPLVSQGPLITDTRTSGFVQKRRLSIHTALNALVPSIELLQVWPTSLGQGSSVVRLWVLARNRGTAALPASAHAWFFVNGYGYTGSVSLGGLAAGATAWYFQDWTVPFTMIGSTTYQARVWDGTLGGFWASTWTATQPLNLGSPTTITSLWPVYDTAGGPPHRNDTVRLWANVRNNRGSALPAAGVWAFVQPWGPVNPAGWVANAALTGQAANTTVWRQMLWAIPGTYPLGDSNYYAQVWYLSGTWRQWTPLYGPQLFRVQ